METDKIKVLLKAVETCSLSGAAKVLGYTPSGISRIITNLEEEMGFRLLNRSSSGVTPTYECRQLIMVMNNLVNQAELFEQAVEQVSGVETGSVVVATVYDLFYHGISKMINSFVKDYPGINVKFITGSSSFLAEKLENREIDLCLISHRVGSFKWIPLFIDDLVVWVNEQHPCAQQTAYPIERFVDDPYISVFPDTEPNDVLFFKRENISPNIRFSASDVDVAYSMVEAGLGVTVVNGLSAESRVRSGKVVTLHMKPRQRTEVGLAYQQNNDEAPAARHFIRFAVEYFCGNSNRDILLQKN